MGETDAPLSYQRPASHNWYRTMSNYQLLRIIRIVLWAAFLLSLPLAPSFTASDPLVTNIVRYSTPVLLLLALLVGLMERMVRKRHNLPVKPLWRT